MIFCHSANTASFSALQKSCECPFLHLEKKLTGKVPKRPSFCAEPQYHKGFALAPLQTQHRHQGVISPLRICGMTSAALAHVPLSSAPVMFARSSRIIDEYTPPSFSPEVSPTFSFVSLASEERLSNNEESTLQQGETNHLNLSCSCEEMVEFLSGEKFVSSHRAGATTSVAGDWAFGAEGMMVMTNFRLVFIPFSLFSLLLSVSSREQSPCLHENGAQTSSIDSPLPSSPLDNKYDANNNDNTDRSPSSNNDGDHDTSPPPSYAHPCSFRVNLTDIQESVAGAHRPRVTCQFPECRKEAQLASISQENEAKFFTLSLPLASIYHIECRYQYQALNHSPNGDEPAADCGYRGPWPSQFPPEWRRETVGMFEVDCKSFRSVLFICLSDSADALSPNRLPPVFSSSELVENSFQEHSSSMDAESRRRGRSVSVKTTINPKGLPENQKQQEQKREQVQGRGQEQEQEQQQEQEQPLSVSESFAEGMTFDNMCVSPTPSSGFPPQQGEKDPRSLFALGTLYNWCPPSWHLGYLGTSASGTEAAKQVDDDGFPLQLEGDDGNRSYPPSSYSSSSSSSPTISDAMFFDQFLKSLTQNSLFLEGSSHVHPSASSTAGSSSSSSSLGGARKKAAASCPDKLFCLLIYPNKQRRGEGLGMGSV